MAENYKVPRAKTYEDISRITFKEIPFEGEWLVHLGRPELGNSHWIIRGESGHGKTSYALQVAKEISKYQRVHYNSLEEGTKKSFKMALDRENIKAIKSKFTYEKETLEQLTKRLDRPKQPKVIIIDSVQYFFRGKRQQHYFDFINRFQNTTFIWICQMENGKPKGAIASDVTFDCDIVIDVQDFKATIYKNRFMAYEPKIISQEKHNIRNPEVIQKG